jgi:hypothetical protein
VGGICKMKKKDKNIFLSILLIIFMLILSIKVIYADPLEDDNKKKESKIL